MHNISKTARASVSPCRTNSAAARMPAGPGASGCARDMTDIRPYRADDLAALYEICLKTGDSGKDATALYDDPKLIGHVYACLLYTSDAADDLLCVDLGGRR